MKATAERARLTGESQDLVRWRKWGPYLSDRSWATVREDYSANCDPWSYFPHDLARSKAYRWGEDGIAGFCDRYQILCWGMAFWNERDPILKERYYGLTPNEANHGEDVKEYYFYVDALPSHAYQRMVYKYPQRAYPYSELLERNRHLPLSDPEFELIDTGIFDEGRYFDIVVEIAKESEETIVFRVTAHNRGPEKAPLHLIPNLWFRNTWSWANDGRTPPSISVTNHNGGEALLVDDSGATALSGLLTSTHLGPHIFEVPKGAQLIFTNNETNMERVYGPGATSRTPYQKDAFHRLIVNREESAVNPLRTGTKAAAWLRLEIEPGDSETIVMRLGPQSAKRAKDMHEVVELRRREADEFYESIHPPHASVEERSVQRQAFAGMLWSKQSYLFDVDVWLDGDDPNNPPPDSRRMRNTRWRHLNSMRVLSMPDKWEYPWFAAWDLAFHAVVYALVDQDYAKEQIWLMLFEQFQHPNGQIPAYEWEFSDLNPPVQAWAAWRIYNMDRVRNNKPDHAFLEKCFHKLLLNFTWWVNKVDSQGNNVFEGGFLGLDNIALWDRSVPFPGGAVLEQSDATGWMGMFSLTMMRMALELAKENPVYEGLATKFFEHYVYIGAAMKMVRGDRTLWDEQDGFFYDLLRYPNGHTIPFRVRSLVGLIPLYAVERLEGKWIAPFPHFSENMNWFLKHRADIVSRCVTTVEYDHDFTHVLAVVDRNQLQYLLARVVDTKEFLSPYGMRSLSKYHQKHPFHFGDATLSYEPGEAEVVLKGGNSNWRGPIWFPTTFLMIETLRKLEKAFGGSVQLEVEEEITHRKKAKPGDQIPTAQETGDMRAYEAIGGGASDSHHHRGLHLGADTAPPAKTVTLSGLAAGLADRTIHLFIPDDDGYRPLYGPRGTRKAELFANDPHWKDLVLFHEYFHGDTGEGLGASHQTGWTGLVANLIDEWRR